jgi:dephospho-CoA kinase
MIYGLTGGIGCGKSTVSHMMSDMGAAVWDADHEVHNLYRFDVPTLVYVKQNYPECLDHRTMVVDRRMLGDIMFHDSDALARLNQHISARLQFSLKGFYDFNSGDKIKVLDVPLLFETGMDAQCDAVIVVHCPPDVQRARVKARGWDDAKIDAVLARQWTNEQRFPKATHLIDTTRPLDETRALLWDILRGKA